MEQHRCFPQIDKKLEEQNARLSFNLLNPNHIFIETEKIDAKKRGKPPKMIASYCPFCGEKLSK